MNREDYEAAKAALNEITEILGWNARARVAQQYSTIENLIEKYAPEKTEEEKIQERIAELDEKIFEMNMKDTLSRADWNAINAYEDEIRQLKEKLNA